MRCHFSPTSAAYVSGLTSTGLEKISLKDFHLRSSKFWLPSLLSQLQTTDLSFILFYILTPRAANKYPRLQPNVSQNGQKRPISRLAATFRIRCLGLNFTQDYSDNINTMRWSYPLSGASRNQNQEDFYFWRERIAAKKNQLVHTYSIG